MQLYFTTVFRGAPLKEAGQLVRLDWSAKAVTAIVPIYPSNPGFEDPNPRGGGRGGRGILALDGHLMAASFHTIHVYNCDLQHLYDLTHPHFVGLHEIKASRPDHIWVASTIIDLALEINVKTGEASQQYWARELPGLQDALHVEPMGIDKSADNRLRYLDPKHLRHPSHLHLSDVTRWQGEVYALFGVRGVIANLDRQEVVVHDPELKPGHNLHILDDGTAVVLGTFSRTIRCYDIKTGQLMQVIDLMQYKWVKDLMRRPDRVYRVNRLLQRTPFSRGTPARPLFLRGMDIVGRKAYIGAAPALILCIDLDSGSLLDTFLYSSNVSMSVHGIKVIDDTSSG